MENIVKNIRFTKDYNLPINIFNEEMFSYYRELYKDFWPFDAEHRMNQEIKQFNDNVDEWLAHYAKIRDNIIFSLENSEKYKEFNTCDLSKYDIPNLGIGEHSLYTEENEGKHFLSIDLKKANFQGLKYVGVISDDTYRDFIYRNNGSNYFADSKYLRQVIFGKLNPKRTIKVEKFLIYQIYLDCIREYGIKNLYSLNSDEIVFTDNVSEERLQYIEKKCKDLYGIEVKAEMVQISRLDIINDNGNKVDAYIRKNDYTGYEVLKKASTTFFPQIWKLYKGLEITEMDRKVYFENQIATFDKPLKLREK